MDPTYYSGLPYPGMLSGMMPSWLPGATMQPQANGQFPQAMPQNSVTGGPRNAGLFGAINGTQGGPQWPNAQQPNAQANRTQGLLGWLSGNGQQQPGGLVGAAGNAFGDNGYLSNMLGNAFLPSMSPS